MSKINIAFMTDEAVEILRNNKSKVVEYMKNNREDSSWLKEICGENIFEIKKYKIPEITLNIGENNYKDVDFENSIKIYEALKDLPRYIKTDEKFWLWFNFTIGYKAALQAMPIKSETTFKDHWLFSQANRRSIFFNVLARSYFRVELTVDYDNPDKYELTRFVIENPERFRNLTWRNNSSLKQLVKGVLWAEKDILNKYKDIIDVERIRYGGSGNVYTELAKSISLYGSVRLLDVMNSDSFYHFAYGKLDSMVQKQLG